MDMTQQRAADTKNRVWKMDMFKRWTAFMKMNK